MSLFPAINWASMGSDFIRSLLRTVSISVARRICLVSNSAEVDQCQSRCMKPLGREMNQGRVQDRAHALSRQQSRGLRGGDRLRIRLTIGSGRECWRVAGFHRIAPSVGRSVRSTMRVLPATLNSLSDLGPLPASGPLRFMRRSPHKCWLFARYSWPRRPMVRTSRTERAALGNAEPNAALKNGSPSRAETELLRVPTSTTERPDTRAPRATAGRAA
jgi:hypothetical protein